MTTIYIVTKTEGFYGYEPHTTVVAAFSTEAKAQAYINARCGVYDIVEQIIDEN